MQIRRSGDCGNSPKNVLVEALTIALAKRDARALDAALTEDVRWHVAGRAAVSGRAALDAALAAEPAIATLTIAHVISHGRAGAVNGSFEDANGAFEFCNVYEFASAKGDRVKAVTAYRIASR